MSRRRSSARGNRSHASRHSAGASREPGEDREAEAPASSSGTSWWYPLLLAAATAFAYERAVHDGMVHDDASIAPRALPTSAAAIVGLFRENLWADTSTTVGLYRPALIAGFALENLLHGPSARAMHTVTVGLHVLATLALFALLRARLSRDPAVDPEVPPRAAFAGALLFGVHPIHTDAVCSVFNRAEVILTLCALGALALVESARRIGVARAWGAAAGLYFFALLHKESAVMIPVILALKVALEPSRDAPPALADRLRPLLWFVAPTAVYLLLREAALGAMIRPVEPMIPFAERIPLTASSLVDASRMIAWPHPLRASYSDDRPVWPLLDVAILAAILGGAAWSARRAPSVALGVGGLVLYLLPSTKLVTGQHIHFLGERHVYLPSALVALPLAAGLARLPSAARAYAGVAVACVAALSLAQTRARCLEWQSDTALFEAEARVAPDAGDTWRLLVSAYSRAGRTAEAMAACDAHLARHPTQAQLAINCGNAYDQSGRADDAERAYRLAARGYLSAVAHHNLGHMLLRLGRRAEAEAEYRLSAEQEQDPARRHYRRGMWLVQFHLERRAEAQREFEAALAIQPRYAPALRMLRELGVR
jgi:hypothetical protein